MRLQNLFLLITFTSVPSLLFAHGSHGSGMMAGFTHPIFGLDHNFAILGCGILAYLLDQKKWYLYPLSFIIAMILGGLLGIGNEASPMIEKVIAISVIAIGLGIGARIKLNFIVALIMLITFGIVHGYAHGAEMPETNTALKYISGYTLGALLLGLVGMLISKIISTQEKADIFICAVGAIIFLFGIKFLLF